MSAPSSSASPSASTHGRPKGRARACTNCRQVKLKCDARETWPNSCSRCKSQGTGCRMDSSFRRVPARRQLEEVSQKLNSLQRLLDAGQQSSPIAATLLGTEQQTSPAATAPVPVETSSSVDIAAPIVQQALPTSIRLEANGALDDSLGPDAFLQLEEGNVTAKWALGGVTLDYDTSKALFTHYAQTKWRHAPILQPCNSIEKLYNTSELLFWTIILQAARNHGIYGGYYAELLPHHRSLLGESILGQPSMYTLHTLLLVCTWPYPNPRLTSEEVSPRIVRNRDTSWPLLGAAANMATMMGLHKPGRQEEFDYEVREPEQIDNRDTYIRNITWLYTFYLVSSQSSWLGVSPPFTSTSHLDTIARMCQDESLPKRMRAKIDIQRRVVQFTIQLDTTLDLRTRYSLVDVFDRYLDRSKEGMFRGVWTQELEIDYLAAKLYLYGIAFVSSPTKLGYAVAEDPGIMARNILQRGLTAAVRLCHTVCNLNLDEIPVPGNYAQKLSSYNYQLSWYPKRFNLAAAFATIYLAWYLAVDTKASEADRQLARKYMNDIRKLYASFHHSQEHMNISRKLENLTSIPTSAPKLTVSSRLGASFMYSYNFMYRYLRASDTGAKENDARGGAQGSNEAGEPGSKPVSDTAQGTSNFISSDMNKDTPMSFPDSWEMPWSDWDPSIFEDLQNMTWGQTPWDADLLMTGI